MSFHRSTVTHRIFASLTIIALLVFGNPGHASAARIIRVKHNATGSPTGASWANAYTTLQQALAVAAAGDQVWVARGTYKPGSARSDSFILKDGVRVYGGFAGTETALSQRNWKANPTTLSGDIGTPGDTSDNSYHVAKGTSLSSLSVLDGFRVVDGNSDGGGYDAAGAGIFISGGAPSLRNLTVSGNVGTACAGMYSESTTASLKQISFQGNTAGAGAGLCTHSDVILEDVSFTNNHATYNGGGFVSDSGSPSLTDVTFTGNHADHDGGAVYADTTGTITFNRVTFFGNSASAAGGAVYNVASSPSLTDVVFDQNFVVGPSGPGGGAMYSISSNPSLANVTFTGNYVDGTNFYHNGGAMFNDSSNPLLFNVTFAANTAKGSGGSGGAMYNSNYSDPILENVTFYGNAAANGGGSMYNTGNASPSIYNSILWGNGAEFVLDTSTVFVYDSIVAGGCPYLPNCAGTILDADPHLGPLKNNGGFAPTMALGTGSLAIDAGNDISCLNADARGVVRPMGLHCDMGAYEVRAMKFVSVGSQDGQVLESGKNTNLGSSVNTKSPIILLGDSAKNKRYRGFLSFNTGPLPGNVKVVGANIQFLQQSFSGNPFVAQGRLTADIAKPYFGAEVGLVTSDWQAKPSAAAAVPYPPDLQFNGTWYTAFVNSTALSKINKSGTTQFRLRFPGKSYNGIGETIGIASGNDPIVANRPFLVVYYNP